MTDLCDIQFSRPILVRTLRISKWLYGLKILKDMQQNNSDLNCVIVKESNYKCKPYKFIVSFDGSEYYQNLYEHNGDKWILIYNYKF